MKSLKIYLITTVALAGLASIPASAVEYTVKMYSKQDPGAYFADPDDALASKVLGNYAAGAKMSIGGQVSFWSMCVELDEYFSHGATYKAKIEDSTARAGGNNTNAGDPISVGAAYLYKQFVTGALFDLTFGNGAKVQKAIWYLEENFVSGKTVMDAGLESVLVSVFGSVENAKADYTGNEVKVMNLTSLDGRTPKQDQLVLWHVPDSGATLTMLGAALCALAIYRRRSA